MTIDIPALLGIAAPPHGRSSFLLEWHREMKRHAGDHRLPHDLRARLRERARRSLVEAGDAAAAVPFPRRRLRQGTPALPPALVTAAAAAGAAAGIPRDRPVVALDAGRRPDTVGAAAAWLAGQGYGIVRIGEPSDPIDVDGIVDATARFDGTEAVALAALMAARFVVCRSVAMQQLAYVTGTPSLLLDARDPFSGYPIRPDGLFTIATAVDLDTGTALTPLDLLDERYLRTRRNYGFRSARPEQVLASVREMHDGVTGGFTESAGQAAFRRRVEAAGAAIAAHVPFVAEWGPDEGFIGDGRLARWQAGKVNGAP